MLPPFRLSFSLVLSCLDLYRNSYVSFKCVTGSLGSPIPQCFYVCYPLHSPCRCSLVGNGSTLWHARGGQKRSGARHMEPFWNSAALFILGYRKQFEPKVLL